MMRRLGGLVRRPGAGWLLASVALGVAALATLGGRDHSPTASIVVAREEIPAGVRLSGQHVGELLERVEVPHAPALEGVLQRPEQAIDGIVAVGLAAGEPVTPGALEGRADVGVRPLLPGERAISVNVAEPGPGIRPGARVDVVLAGSDPGGSARVVVSAAELLSVGDGESLGGTRVVSLRVGARDALEIAGASGIGSELRLLLRAPGDTAGEGLAP